MIAVTVNEDMRRNSNQHCRRNLS